MQTLESPDSHHLNAAIGWLGLGCANDARAELAAISSENQIHPAVLETLWILHVREQHWRDALEIAQTEITRAPDDSAGWLHRAYALRRVGGGSMSQAWDALLPAAKKFPAEPVIAFNLACYACQMAQLDLARQWLQQALKIGGQTAIKKMALADDDLKPLWAEIAEM